MIYFNHSIIQHLTIMKENITVNYLQFQHSYQRMENHLK